MKKLVILTFVTASAWALAGAAAAADYRIGVVNALKVLEAAPQAENARQAIEEEFATRDRELVAAQKSLKSMEDKLSKDGAIMSESERARLQRDIVRTKRELKRDQDEFREDYNFRRNEELGKIQREVAKAIQTIARERDYDLILSDGVIFASDKVDVTGLVLDHLKQQYQESGQ